MPKLGLTMEEGTVARWCKQVGDAVVEGETLLEVESDKATLEVPAEASGILLQILAEEGRTVPVATPIAYIGQAGETPGPAAGAAATPHAAAAPPGRVRATPAARRLARETGIALEAVPGQGPAGRIHTADVQAYVAAQAAPPASQARPRAAAAPPAAAVPGAPEAAGAVARQDRLIPLSPMRRTIARRLSEGYHATVPVILTAEVNLTAAVRLKDQLAGPIERRFGTRLTWTALVVRAAALALCDHLALNAALEGEALRQFGSVHIGIAVAVPDGLLVPVVRNADRKSIGEIAAEAATLAGWARDGRLPAGALDGGTFSVTNLGPYGIDAFTPIINPPQVAILGVGQVAERPVAAGGQIVAAPATVLSLVFDHRAVDGAPAAAFLAQVKHLLQNPHELIV